MTTITHPTTESPSTLRQSAATVETLAYAIVLAAALALRLLDLAALPLTPGEAGAAWSAWLDATLHTAPDVAAPVSALLYTLHRLTFVLFGGGDGLARLFPALVGAGMVVLPWFMRSRLGRVPALLAALLLAVDPWLITASRQADSTILSVGLGLLLLVGLVRLADGVAWTPALAVAAGLFLISGPGTWSFLPVLLLFGLLFLFGKSEEVSSIWGRQNLVTVLVSGLLGATVWLLHPAGLAAVGTSLGAWVGHFSDQGYPVAWAGLRLLRDQLWLLFFGVGGLALLLQDEDRSLGFFLTGWTVWALFLLLLPGRTPGDLPLLSLPLLLAAPRLLAWPWTTPWTGADRQEGLLMGGILTAILVTGVFWLIQYANTGANSAGLNAALSVVLSLFLVFFFGWWANWPLAGRVSVLLGTGLLIMAGVSTGWQISVRTDPPGTLGYVHTVPDLDTRQLAQDIRTLSAQRVGDAASLPVQIQVDPVPDPLLGWYLREMRDLRWVLAPDVTQESERSPLVIVPGGGDPDAAMQPVLPAGYVGSTYRIRQSFLPSDLPDAKARLRWFLYQQPPAERPGDYVVLWAMLTD